MTAELFAIIAPVFLIAGIGLAWGRLKLPFDTATVTAIATNVGTPALILSTLAQLEVSGADILCAGPKYQWDFSDRMHLTSDSYRRMGEQMGAMAAARLAGQRAGPPGTTPCSRRI